MSLPLITIAIICFREGKLLLDCWRSVLEQTHQQWEAVIVMDGGADAATKNAFEAISHPRVRKFANAQNQGLFATRNRAFAETRTPFHYYLDGDDALSADALETVMAAYAKAPNADIYYTDLLSESPDGTLTPIRSRPGITPDAFTEGFCLYGGNIISKAIWEKVGGYCASLRSLGDLDFYIGAMEKGAVFCHVPELLYVYRRRQNSNSNRYFADIHRNYEVIAERHPQFFADARRRNLFLALGYMMAAHVQFSLMKMNVAESLAKKALAMGKTVEATALLRKIERDRFWPKPLLRIRRIFSVFLERKLGERRLRKARRE